MIGEQKRLLGEGVDISKDGEIIKVKKEWNENIITDGGISYYKMNGKLLMKIGSNYGNGVIVTFKLVTILKKLHVTISLITKQPINQSFSSFSLFISVSITFS